MTSSSGKGPSLASFRLQLARHAVQDLKAHLDLRVTIKVGDETAHEDWISCYVKLATAVQDKMRLAKEIHADTGKLEMQVNECRARCFRMTRSYKEGRNATIKYIDKILSSSDIVVNDPKCVECEHAGVDCLRKSTSACAHCNGLKKRCSLFLARGGSGTTKTSAGQCSTVASAISGSERRARNAIQPEDLWMVSSLSDEFAARSASEKGVRPKKPAICEREFLVGNVLARKSVRRSLTIAAKTPAKPVGAQKSVHFAATATASADKSSTTKYLKLSSKRESLGPTVSEVDSTAAKLPAKTSKRDRPIVEGEQEREKRARTNDAGTGAQIRDNSIVIDNSSSGGADNATTIVMTAAAAGAPPDPFGTHNSLFHQGSGSAATAPGKSSSTATRTAEDVLRAFLSDDSAASSGAGERRDKRKKESDEALDRDERAKRVRTNVTDNSATVIGSKKPNSTESSTAAEAITAVGNTTPNPADAEKSIPSFDFKSSRDAPFGALLGGGGVSSSDESSSSSPSDMALEPSQTHERKDERKSSMRTVKTSKFGLIEESSIWKRTVEMVPTSSRESTGLPTGIIPATLPASGALVLHTAGSGAATWLQENSGIPTPASTPTLVPAIFPSVNTYLPNTLPSAPSSHASTSPTPDTSANSNAGAKVGVQPANDVIQTAQASEKSKTFKRTPPALTPTSNRSTLPMSATNLSAPLSHLERDAGPAGSASNSNNASVESDVKASTPSKDAAEMKMQLLRDVLETQKGILATQQAMLGLLN